MRVSGPAPAGLIAAGVLENPVKYAHIVTSTTHKTLRGPRGGVIMMGKDFPNPWGKTTPKGEIKMMSQLLDSAVFPGVQGGPLEHVIAAKAVAFGEILQPEFKEYAKQVQKNAAVLAQALIDRGFTIVSGGTDNHSMLVDLRSKYPDLTGKVAEKALVSADITVNKNRPKTQVNFYLSRGCGYVSHGTVRKAPPCLFSGRGRSGNPHRVLMPWNRDWK